MHETLNRIDAPQPITHLISPIGLETVEVSEISITNANKLSELNRFGLSLRGHKVEVPELQLTDLHRSILKDGSKIGALKVAEFITEAKAITAMGLHSRPIMVEDTSLYGLGPLARVTGPNIKNWDDPVLLSILCRMAHAEGLTSALAVTVLAVANRQGETLSFSGAISGSFSKEPRGQNGFGWDSIFVPEGQNRTFAEMDQEEKDHHSMRRLSVEKLRLHVDRTAG